MRSVFYNQNLNNQFLEKGYVMVDFLSSDKIELLKEYYNKKELMIDRGFYLTALHDDPENRLLDHNFIQEIITPVYSSIINEYEPIISSFVVKHSRSDSAWHPHQDDTFVEESTFISLSIWFPLISTNNTNGTLAVIPGSHTLYTAIRSPNIPPPFSKDSVAMRLEDVELDAGQAIIFDHRLIHASGNNISGKDRIAVVTALKPREAKLIHAYLDQTYIPAMIKEYEISEKYFIEDPIGEYSQEPDPKKYKLLSTYPYIEFKG